MKSSGISHMTRFKSTVRKKNPKPSIIAKCVDCQSEIEVSVDGSTSSQYVSKWVQIEDDLFKFSFFDCPECGRRHLVQVDSEVSEKYLSKLVEAMKHRQLSRVQKLQRYLDLARKAARGKVEGKHYFDPDSGLDYIIEFVEEDDCVVRRIS